MIEVILVGHKARVGKDTLANYLELHGYTRVAFADKLKDLTADLYRMSVEQMYGEKKDVLDTRYNLTPRQVLQQFGQAMRAIYPMTWAEHLFLSTIDRLVRHGATKFVVPDFRFPNELQTALRWAQNHQENTGQCAVVKSVKVTRETSGVSGANDISETALDAYASWDKVFENNGTIDEFENSVGEWLVR